MSLNKKMVFFNPGDVVKVRHLKLKNIPTMVVKEVKKLRRVKEEDKSILMYITCFWFDQSSGYQEAGFSTKDLVKIETT